MTPKHVSASKRNNCPVCKNKAPKNKTARKGFIEHYYCVDCIVAWKATRQPQRDKEYYRKYKNGSSMRYTRKAWIISGY